MKKINIKTDKFYNYHQIRTKKSRARRASGGISILIRHGLRGNLKHKCVTIMKGNDFTVWLQLSSKHLMLEAGILCRCLLYTPRKSSYYQSTGNLIDPFLQIEEDVMKLGQIILLGDFNARTAQLVDYLVSNGPSTLQKLGRLGRNNIDTKINKIGRQLT